MCDSGGSGGGTLSCSIDPPILFGKSPLWDLRNLITTEQGFWRIVSDMIKTHLTVPTGIRENDEMSLKDRATKIDCRAFTAF